MTTDATHDDAEVTTPTAPEEVTAENILDDPPPPFDDDASRVAAAAVEQLRARRFSYGDERRQMEQSLHADTIYSDDYKAKLLDGFKETAEAEAAALATRAWRETLAAEQGLADEVAREAQQADAGIDHAAMATYSTDYSSRLSMPPPATGADQRTDRILYISKLADEAEASRSPERMRAFRIAAAPVVRSLVNANGVGTTDRQARELDQRISAMAARERGNTANAEARLNRIRQRKAEVRYEILNLEQAVTGARPTMFAPITPWAGRILGERIEDYGGGVHSRTKS